MNALPPVPAEDFSRTPRLLIRASAGTGKTFQLSNRYLSLLRRCPADRILAVTFTRKAAGEILERILIRLATAVLNEDRRRELSAFLGGDELTQPECERLLASTARQLHRVKVSTLDSFFSRLAMSVPLEIGLPPNWSIADQQTADRTVLQAIDDVLRGADEKETRRLVHLLAKGVIPRSIANLLTTTVQTHYDIYRLTRIDAWQKIQPPNPLTGEEQDELLEELAKVDVSVGKALHSAIQKDLVKWRNGEWEDFLAKGPANCVVTSQPKYYNKDLPPRIVEIYGRLVHHVKALLLKIWASQIAAVHELLTAFHSARQQRVLETGQLRFDDIAVALAERMREVDARALVHRLDGDVDHLLLDEFQDTSLLQWDVLRPFVTALDTRRDTSFFCVGDVKQAIYGWRGGVAALFDKVQRETPGVQSGMLNESRRSAPAVMTAVNRVFQHLDLHPNLGDLAGDVEEWQRSFPEHSTAKTNMPGYVRLETSQGETAGTDQRPGADGKRDRCVGRTVDIVAEVMTNRPDVTIGILARKNEMIGRVIHALGERGIAASEEGGVRLTTSAAVQLIQSVLRFADHPGDSIATFHLGHSPLGPVLGVAPKMGEIEAEAASLAIREELTVAGYESAVERWSRVLEPQCSERDWARLRRLCVLAAEYQSTATLRPADFASRIDDERVEEATASRVRVMTIHKSKGLEFDVVILPDLDVDLFDTPKVCVGCPAPAERPETVLIHRNASHQQLLPPAVRRAFDEQRRTDVHESLCCLYVAMTRAAHALHMVIAPQAPTKSESTTYLKTAAGLLRATLATRPDLPPETVLYEYGNPRWYDELPSPNDLHMPAPRVPVNESHVITFQPRTGGRSRGRDATSPSKSKAVASVGAAQLLSLDAAEGMERGTLWHLWCQQLRWLDDSAIDVAQLYQVGRAYCRPQSKLLSEAESFIAAIQRPEIRKLFLTDTVLSERHDLPAGASAECRTESGFSLFTQGRWMTGMIDRLVLFRRDGKVVAADVVDFKTDLAGEASKLRRAYREQIRHYAGAVATAYAIDVASIHSKLVWLTSGTVEPVETAPAMPTPQTVQQSLFSRDEI